MAIKFPVATPTPHLDYSIRYNQQFEKRVQEQKAYYDKWGKHYQEKLEHYQQVNRINKARELQKIAEDIHAYEVLESKKAYEQYRYMFYVGTKVDVYI